MQTVEQKTYQAMRRKLLAGAWRPGQQLSALAIAQQIGVSPTPVTQALRRLERDGFVDVVPHFGAFVRRPRLRELAELFDLRRALEAFAVRRAARRADEAQLARLQKLIDDWTKTIDARRGGNEADEKLIARAVEADLLFHMVVMQIDGNRRALEVFQDCHLLTRLFGSQVFDADADALAHEEDDLADHRAILEAMRRRDGAAAARTMDKHLRRGRRSLIESVRRSRSLGDVDAQPPPWSRGIWAALRKVESHGASSR